ncbi:MAG TPA: 30S ribosomal protein S20 [Polyangiaceae bacterium]|nr:30S ribosomal protein S20 [Polyangiaceae bacterium]
MADHASAVKRNRQRIKRTLRNRGIDNKVKSALKKARVAVASSAAGKNSAAGKQAKDLVLAASKALARAASKGAMHSRAASRKIARLNSALSKSAAK